MDRNSVDGADGPLNPPGRAAQTGAVRQWLKALFAAFAIGLASYPVLLLYPRAPDHLRYKLTIEAVYNGRAISGSSVIGVERTWRRRLDLSWETETFVEGEAAILEFGPKGNLVATLASIDTYGRVAERWPYWGEIFE
jgi:hypothetical protein